MLSCEYIHVYSLSILGWLSGSWWCIKIKSERQSDQRLKESVKVQQTIVNVEYNKCL